MGTAYKLSPSAGDWILTVLHNFGGSDEGGGPFGGLVLDAAGNLYGTTSGGFVDEFGSVFELSHVGAEWQETILYRFAGVDAGDGAMPETSLFLQSNTLYGTTIVGGDPACRGAGGCGTVFAIR